MQQEFAFIPDDGSNTFVINVENNSTAPLAGPSTKDAKATYAASITALVQLDSTGAISFLPYKQGDATTNTAAKWASVDAVNSVVPAGSVSPSNSSSASPSGSSGASGAKPSSPAKSGSSSQTSGSASPSQTQTGGDAQQTGAALPMGSASVALAAFAALLGASHLL